MGDSMRNKNDTKDKEGKKMAVSMAVVPLLKGEAAKALKRDFKKSGLKEYSDVERKNTQEKIAKILAERK